MINTEDNMTMKTHNTYIPWLNKRTVMIISPSEDQIRKISRYLYHESFNCLKEYNCEQAAETLTILNVAFVLIDTHVTPQESQTMIRWLEENRPEIHVFFITLNELNYELGRPESSTQSPMPITVKKLTEVVFLPENSIEPYDN